MKRRFWKFVHDRLEQAWHWVYRNKLSPLEPLPTIGDVQYSFSYVCGKTGMISNVLFSITDSD